MSDLSVLVEELSPVVRRLQVEVPAERVSKVTEAVYQRVGRTVKLKGYRPGHIPRHALEKHFADQVKGDIARELVEQTLAEALGTLHLSPVTQPVLEPQEVKAGEPFSYSARVEIQPEVKLGRYRGLEVVVQEREVTEARVDEELERLRQALAPLTPVEDRDEVQLGDHVGVSYEIRFPGGERPEEKRDDALMRAEAGDLLDGRVEKLVGAKVGETREWTERFGANAATDLQGREVRLVATVRGIKKRELPALDDEMAKDLGIGTESLEELRQKIRRDQEERAAKVNEAVRERALLEKLMEETPFEVPPALVDGAAAHETERYLERLAQGGFKLDVESPAVDRFHREMLAKAAFDVKCVYLLDAIATAESIEASESEIEALFQKQAEEHGVPAERTQVGHLSADQKRTLANEVRHDKALELVKSSAVFRRPESEPAAKADEKPETNSGEAAGT